MFFRHLRWNRWLRRNEGFWISYSRKSVTYREPSRAFQFGFEDGYLSAQVASPVEKWTQLTEADQAHIVDRLLMALRGDEQDVQIYTS